MPDPTVMFGAMEVNPRQPPLKRLMMEHLQGEQLRKVQSMGNLRGGDAAPAICRVVEGVPREPVLPNANGYTSDTAVPTTSARQRNTAPMRGGSFSRQPCQPCPISSSHTPSYRSDGLTWKEAYIPRRGSVALTIRRPAQACRGRRRSTACSCSACRSSARCVYTHYIRSATYYTRSADPLRTPTSPAPLTDSCEEDLRLTCGPLGFLRGDWCGLAGGLARHLAALRAFAQPHAGGVARAEVFHPPEQPQQAQTPLLTVRHRLRRGACPRLHLPAVAALVPVPDTSLDLSYPI
jgi:hypothetical protein